MTCASVGRIGSGARGARMHSVTPQQIRALRAIAVLLVKYKQDRVVQEQGERLFSLLEQWGVRWKR